MERFGLKRVPAATGSLTTLFCVITMVATPVVSSDDTEEAKGNGTERYHLVVWDFHHVEVPYVICLWILLASVAKIGEFLRWISVSKLHDWGRERPRHKGSAQSLYKT